MPKYLTQEWLDLSKELAQEFPAMAVSEIGYTANAQVISTQDELSGDLIDVLAR